MWLGRDSHWGMVEKYWRGMQVICNCDCASGCLLLDIKKEDEYDNIGPLRNTNMTHSGWYRLTGIACPAKRGTRHC
jgi:hypothetical protein